MDTDNVLIVAITIVICAICFSVGACVIHTNNKIAGAIKNGADPVVARLAFENGGGAEQEILRAIYINKDRGIKYGR